MRDAVFQYLYFSQRGAVVIRSRTRWAGHIQGDTKKRELLKNPTKIEEIQEKKLLTETEPLQLAFYETVIQIISV